MSLIDYSHVSLVVFFEQLSAAIYQAFTFVLFTIGDIFVRPVDIIVVLSLAYIILVGLLSLFLLVEDFFRPQSSIMQKIIDGENKRDVDELDSMKGNES